MNRDRCKPGSDLFRPGGDSRGLGGRTYNPLVKSARYAGCNPLPDNTSGDGDAPHVPQHVPADPIAPDLQRVVEAWPDLPPHIRAAVLALVGTAR
jgi:hypothetical protein